MNICIGYAADDAGCLQCRGEVEVLRRVGEGDKGSHTTGVGGHLRWRPDPENAGEIDLGKDLFEPSQVWGYGGVV